jgi:hypothetical protein
MDFRMYDNALGRFHNIDKMTDIMPSLSPYRFAFNNPVLSGDPTGLLESGGGDEENIKTYYGSEEFIIGKAKNKQPASFNYSLVSLSDWRSPNRPTLEQYNKHHGTNYQSVKDWYYNEKYLPAQNKMTTERNQAGRTVIGTLLVLGTAGVGTAYALPVLVACSPAIQSTVATLVTNPTVQQAVLRMGIDAVTQYAAKGNVDIADVAITGAIPTTSGLQAVKPIFQASVDFNTGQDGGFKAIGINKAGRNFGIDVFTGYWQYRVGNTVPAKGNSQAFIEGSSGMVNYFGNLMNKMFNE